ncbi:FAD-dependent oxidoreductase [Aspergillus stella-maris]|uniref:FAD-dependent oxidoreductase n=1 Tax=Aspergillus stella-maris TaxID=1810926 RepID=UPI003CCD063A
MPDHTQAVQKSPFRVIIVGGSITGLTLAHCLERAKIDYVVLEKHIDILAEPGISIGLMPNGSRILEQIGLYNQVDRLHHPYKKIYHCFPDGFCLEADSPVNIINRFGLPFCVIERQPFLDILYAGFKDKSRIHMGKRVVGICHTRSGVSVKSADGTTYTGDLVVGADGVHSTVRSEMWRMKNAQQPGFISEKGKSELAAEFGCVFGVCKAPAGQGQWEHIIRYNRGFCFLFFPVAERLILFNVIFKLKRKSYYPDIPRFSEAEAIQVCESVVDFPVWNNVKFGDLWERTMRVVLVPLEEHLYKMWHYRRIVCVGDSVSKMTPNTGQGANTAIECAAVLTNSLRSLLNANHPDKPLEQTLSCMLEDFNQKQFKRLHAVHADARFVARLEALDGWPLRIFARHFMTYCGDIVTENLARAVKGGSVLDFIPLTVRSGKDCPPCSGQHSWGLLSFF